MKKNMNLTALMLVVSFVCGSMVLTSCSEQVNLDEPEKVEVPVPGPTEYIDRTKTIKQIIDNVFTAQTNKDNLEYRYNGILARRSWVTPAQKILYQPAEEQSEPTLEPKGDGRWIDSNGNEFTATEENYQLDSCVLNASIVGKEKMSLFRIHPQVAEVIADFTDQGMVTDMRTGKSATFSMPIPNVSYFVADSSVQVRWKTETVIEIQHDTTYVDVVRDSIITKTVTEYVTINREKNLAIVNGFGYGELRFFRDGKTFVFRMDLDKTNILCEENAWGIAEKLSADLNGFNLTDAQVGHYTVTKDGVNLENILFQGVTFQKLNDIFKYGTVTTKVAFSYVEDGESIREEYEVSASYFHEKEVKAEPEVVVPEVTNEHTYVRDSTFSAVKDSEGNVIGEKVRLTVTRDDQKVWKIQYLRWETGLLCPTLTGTQVGGNSPLRATSWTDSEYTAEGWSGVDTSREGFTVTATSKEYKFRTSFAKVPGFGGAEESIAECNIIFGTRTCTFKDAETGYTFTISADGVGENQTSVKIVEDQVGTDEAAKAEVNGRGLQYEYCGTHFLSVEQYVGSKLVLTQSRAENLLYPKN